MNTFPREYLSRPESELTEAIQAIKKREGNSLTILGHHYQSDAIVRLSDITGDSFKLSRDAAATAARHIVFCGVRFMAESARVLARPDQIVQQPEPSATCPMAEMADIDQVRKAWETLTALQPGRRIIPVAYMNSSVDIKAFCGAHEGAICTSSNAARVFEWAYEKGDTILFVPDEHLGRNTANRRGMDRRRIHLWDPRRAIDQGQEDRYAQANLILWKGFCHVHTDFTVAQIDQARRDNPGVFVIVHPECPEEVADAADTIGSTEGMIRCVAEASAGDTICIGTEINLVSRLADEYPEVNVIPLSTSMCPNMAKTTLGHLLWTIENLGQVNVVEVDAETTRDAAKALRQMLELG